MNTKTALRHPWIRKFAVDSIKKTERVPPLRSARTKTGQGQRLLRQAVLAYRAKEKTDKAKLDLLQKAFVLIDEDCDGYVSQSDFIPHLDRKSPYAETLKEVFKKMVDNKIETLSFDRTFLFRS